MYNILLFIYMYISLLFMKVMKISTWKITLTLLLSCGLMKQNSINKQVSTTYIKRFWVLIFWIDGIVFNSFIWDVLIDQLQCFHFFLCPSDKRYGVKGHWDEKYFKGLKFTIFFNLWSLDALYPTNTPWV